MSITMNLNDPVWVKLTPVGIDAYRKWNADNGVQSPTFPAADFDGYTKFQLWELMQIFGSACFNGCKVPFETEIRLTPRT